MIVGTSVRVGNMEIPVTNYYIAGGFEEVHKNISDFSGNKYSHKSAFTSSRCAGRCANRKDEIQK